VINVEGAKGIFYLNTGTFLVQGRGGEAHDHLIRIKEELKGEGTRQIALSASQEAAFRTEQHLMDLRNLHTTVNAQHMLIQSLTTKNQELHERVHGLQQEVHGLQNQVQFLGTELNQVKGQLSEVFSFMRTKGYVVESNP